jgi:Flp pilus assembly protein TadG
MRTASRLFGDSRGAAAAELALVLPFLLVIMFGSLEVGNFFMNEHTLVKAVRNGARFAARQPYTNYTTCNGSVGEPAATQTKNVVMRGYLAGGTIITPNIDAADITVTTRCAATAGGQNMTGIYFSRTDGAQIVTVSATVDYMSVVGILGFNAPTVTLNARSEAAVAGT